MSACLNPASSPCGSFPLDVTVAQVRAAIAANGPSESELLHLGSCGVSLLIYKDYVMKTYLTADDYPPDTDPTVMKMIRARSSLSRVLEIIHAAGDCSVSIIGRRFDGDNIIAYMMPIEKIIDSAFPNTNSFDGLKTVKYTSKDERRAFIDQLVALVDRLHSRKIIHGDIKTANLLVCSDGELRFCDFDDARFEHESFVDPYICSSPYASWRRSVLSHEPPTYAEDRHAMGMVIYEIYTGTLPLGDGIGPEASSEDLECAVYERTDLGLWPNMSLVDDSAVAELIYECLQGCSPPPAKARLLPELECVETHIGFRDCRADPTHAYSRVFHCASCPTQFSKTIENCKVRFLRPSKPDVSLSPRCPHCNERETWAYF